MTRAEEIVKEAELCASANTQIIGDWGGYYLGFIHGAVWADEHPHWISVEDELPPIGAIVLVAIPFGGELSVLALSIKDESDLECLSGMTHWMPLPQPPKEGGEG